MRRMWKEEKEAGSYQAAANVSAVNPNTKEVQTGKGQHLEAEYIADLRM